MQQYFVNTLAMPGKLISMTKKQIHHIRHITRIQQEDVIHVADNGGRVLLVEMGYHQGEVAARVVREVRDCFQTGVELILAQGMIKEKKWNYLLQKSVELGMAEIIPSVSSRCVVEIRDEESEEKVVRQDRILCEACGQYKRSTLVRLQPPRTFSQLSQVNADSQLVAYEDTDRKSERLCKVLRAHPSPKHALMVTGSEGDFSADKVEALTATSFHRVSLGGRILHAEAATTSLLGSVEFYYDMAGEKDENDI